MCLRLGESDPKSEETPLISNQPLVMKTLLVIAVICVPLMLFVKPIKEHKMLKKQEKEEITVQDENGEDRHYVAINEGAPEESNTLNDPEDKENKKAHNFGDIFIH